MTARRSAGRTAVSRALWYTKPGTVELRTAPLAPPKPGEARIRMLWSGVSRGTERLVSSGAVPASEWERMRCPLQEGAFPFPVKYGYCAVGEVEDGPAELAGRTVFALHPHQDRFIAPLTMIVPVPDGVPARRATLAANMETALNAHWDAGTGPGDRVVIVGAGIVGLMVAHLAARIPGTAVTVIDVAEGRRPIVEALGAHFATPDAAPGDADVVFHTSASAAGLATALRSAGLEGTVCELSWYGDKRIDIPLGDTFHSRRLKLISSQVGQVAPTRRPRWSYRRRLDAALSLLTDPALDALVADAIPFADAPKRLPALLSGDASASLAPVLEY